MVTNASIGRPPAAIRAALDARARARTTIHARDAMFSEVWVHRSIDREWLSMARKAVRESSVWAQGLGRLHMGSSQPAVAASTRLRLRLARKVSQTWVLLDIAADKPVVIGFGGFWAIKRLFISCKSRISGVAMPSGAASTRFVVTGAHLHYFRLCPLFARMVFDLRLRLRR